MTDLLTPAERPMGEQEFVTLLEQIAQYGGVYNGRFTQAVNAHRTLLSALDRLARDYDLLWRACNEDTPDECPDGCNSYGHVETCKYLDMAEAIIKLKAENDRLAKDAERWQKVRTGLFATPYRGDGAEVVYQSGDMDEIAESLWPTLEKGTRGIVWDVTPIVDAARSGEPVVGEECEACEGMGDGRVHGMADTFCSACNGTGFRPLSARSGEGK